jgi:hypothetical protein
VVARIKAEKNDVVDVALAVVALTAVKFWRVVEPVTKSDESDERPETESVPPKVVLPATAKVPVAIKFVERKFVAFVVEETVSAPPIFTEPIASKIFPTEVVAEPPRTKTFDTVVG